MVKTIRTNYVYGSEDEKKSFFDYCESAFDSQINQCAEYLSKVPDLRFIALTGPSCSGKTTTSQRLIEDFASRGKTVKVVSIDDFYFDREFLIIRAANEGKELDLDSPSTIDNGYLSICINKILRYERVRLPHYNFNLGKRDSYESFDSSSVDIFLFEGIQAVYPEFRSFFEKSKIMTIYICPSSEIITHGVKFSPRELRFARRIVRDSMSRGASPEYSMFLWKSVIENENLHIIPYEDDVDFTIDSTMSYEPAVIKDKLLTLLAQVPVGDENYDEAREMAEKYKDIPSVTDEFIPNESVFREFIGKRESK